MQLLVPCCLIVVYFTRLIVSVRCNSLCFLVLRLSGAEGSKAVNTHDRLEIVMGVCQELGLIPIPS